MCLLLLLKSPKPNLYCALPPNVRTLMKFVLLDTLPSAGFDSPVYDSETSIRGWPPTITSTRPTILGTRASTPLHLMASY